MSARRLGTENAQPREAWAARSSGQGRGSVQRGEPGTPRWPRLLRPGEPGVGHPPCGVQQPRALACLSAPRRVFPPRCPSAQKCLRAFLPLFAEGGSRRLTESLAPCVGLVPTRKGLGVRNPFLSCALRTPSRRPPHPRGRGPVLRGVALGDFQSPSHTIWVQNQARQLLQVCGLALC